MDVGIQNEVGKFPLKLDNSNIILHYNFYGFQPTSETFQILDFFQLIFPTTSSKSTYEPILQFSSISRSGIHGPKLDWDRENFDKCRIDSRNTRLDVTDQDVLGNLTILTVPYFLVENLNLRSCFVKNNFIKLKLR